LSLIADALRLTGDLPGALNAITEARQDLEGVVTANHAQHMNNRYSAIWREGVILGGDGQVSLGRPEDAVASLQEAFDILEELARQGPDDALSRIRFSTAGRELGSILRHRQPERALAVYDHALMRLREVKNNTRARRGEAQIMASSSYVLRHFNRADEARARVDAAVQMLRDTKIYPADRIALDDEAEPVLRAWGDHLADTGETVRAAEVYQELLDKVLASRPEPDKDLAHATGLSRLYEALGALYARTGHIDRARSMTVERREIWDTWSRRLPQNSFIQKQLESSDR
jgi:tetratricopeptide (TPR) repeat protein